MADIVIGTGILVVIMAGFWFTRDVRGASPFDSIERDFDAFRKTRGTDPYETPGLQPPKEY